jgi:hypothetical protein
MIQYCFLEYNVIFFAGGENSRINNWNLLETGRGV